MDGRDPSGGRRALPLILLLLLAVAPYLNALRAGFVFDDRHLVADHPAVAGSFDLGTILTAPYWEAFQGARLWRPVTTLSFAVDGKIAGSAPWFPHLVHLLFHAIVTVLLYRLIRRLLGEGIVAFVAASLFAVHPIHTEAVTWVSGRAELLAAIFGLAALDLAHRRPSAVRSLALPAILLAVGSKESGATIPLVLLFSTWFLRRRSTAPSLPFAFACLSPVILYLVLRRFVLGTWSGPEVHPGDNPMVGTGLLERLPTVLDGAGRYLGLLFWPARLSADYSAPVLGLVRGPTFWLCLGVAGTIALIALAATRRGRPEGWGGGFALLTFSVVSNLPAVIGTILGERLVYLPSAGILLIVAAAASAVARRAPPLRAILLGLLAVALAAGGVRTWDRNRDYRDEATFYEEGVRTQPRSPKMRANLALVRSLQGRHEEALEQAVEAIRLDPGGRDPREVYAFSLEKLGRVDPAIDFLLAVVREDPADRTARRRLIHLLDRVGRAEEAHSLLLAAVEEDPGQIEWTLAAAARAQQRGEFGIAAPLWARAMEEDPASAEAALHLGFCRLRLADPARAAGAYREALLRRPDSAEAANGLAWALLECGEASEEALVHARRAVDLDPSAPHYDTLARVLLAMNDCAEARRAEKRAVALDSTRATYRERLREIEERCRDDSLLPGISGSRR